MEPVIKPETIETLVGNQEVKAFAEEVQELANKHNLDFCLVIEGGRLVCSLLKSDPAVIKAILSYEAAMAHADVPDPQDGYTFMDMWKHFVYDLDCDNGIGDTCYVPITFPGCIGTFPRWYIMMGDSKTKFGIAMKQDHNDVINNICEIFFEFEEGSQYPNKCNIISHVNRGTKKGIIRVVPAVTNQKTFYVNLARLGYLTEEFGELFGHNWETIQNIFIAAMGTYNHEEG